MSTELLRRAAAKLRDDCPIPEGKRAMNFIDFPAAWAMQKSNEVAHLALCSASQTGGAMLCDCGALTPTWVRWMTLLAVADWLDVFAECVADDPEAETKYVAEMSSAVAVARAYLGESA